MTVGWIGDITAHKRYRTSKSDKIETSDKN
jgi:hypothetical protein